MTKGKKDKYNMSNRTSADKSLVSERDSTGLVPIPEHYEEIMEGFSNLGNVQKPKDWDKK